MRPWLRNRRAARLLLSPPLRTSSISAFYPLVYVALVLLTRKHLNRLGATTLLDGAVAGLGAAALCSCFAFNTILHSVGGSRAVGRDQSRLSDRRRLAAHPRGRRYSRHHGPEQNAMAAGRRRDRDHRGGRYVQPLFRLRNTVARRDDLQRDGVAVRHSSHLDRGLGASACSGTRCPSRRPPDSSSLDSAPRPASRFSSSTPLHQVTPVAVGLATATLISRRDSTGTLGARPAAPHGETATDSPSPTT